MRVAPIVLAAGVTCGLAGWLGYRLGESHAGFSETDAIRHYAGLYVAETGRAAEDCLAVPGAHPAVWITVRCGSDGDLRIYHLDRRGAEIGAPWGDAT